jgi:hypothetical protein
VIGSVHILRALPVLPSTGRIDVRGKTHQDQLIAHWQAYQVKELFWCGGAKIDAKACGEIIIDGGDIKNLHKEP